MMETLRLQSTVEVRGGGLAAEDRPSFVIRLKSPKLG